MRGPRLLGFLWLLRTAGSSLKFQDGGGNKPIRSSLKRGKKSPREVLVTTSRVFTEAHGNKSDNGEDWINRLNWVNPDDITIVNFMDSGRFSNVFEVSLINQATQDLLQEVSDEEHINLSRYVLKVLKHTFSGKAKREIRILELLKGARGVVRLLGVSRNTACFPKTVSLLFEHLPNTQWMSHQHLVSSSSSIEPTPWTLEEIRIFTYKLLEALRECHSRGVMHRDIKPRNVICQRISTSSSENLVFLGNGMPNRQLHSKKTQLRLIDFGLSEIYVPRAKYNPSVASRHYKCPELLFEYCYYDYGVDIWSAGCILAGLIFKVEPFFYGADLLDQVTAVASVVGSKALLEWTEKCNLRLTALQRKAIGNFSAVLFDRFCNDGNSHLCCHEAIDLLKGMLCVDHQLRATVDSCLAHPFFDPVRGT